MNFISLSHVPSKKVLLIISLILSSVQLISSSIRNWLVKGEGTVFQCLWQLRQFICRQNSLLWVTVLWWQLGGFCAKSWPIWIHFLPSCLLTFILFLCKDFCISFDIFACTRLWWLLKKIPLGLFCIGWIHDCDITLVWHTLLYTYI